MFIPRLGKAREQSLIEMGKRNERNKRKKKCDEEERQNFHGRGGGGKREGGGGMGKRGRGAHIPI